MDLPLQAHLGWIRRSSGRHSVRWACVLAVLFILIFPARSLAGEIAFRVRFGLTDSDDSQWDGTVAVDHGQVERIEGWRFRDEDRVNGVSGWIAATRSVATHRTNAPVSGTGTPDHAPQRRRSNPDMADNGVFLLLANAEEHSVVRINTKQGDFQFQPAEAPYGTVIEKLAGAVDIERVAPTRALTSDGDDHDYPSVVVAPDGTAYLAWIGFTPGIDRNHRPYGLKEKPDDYSFLAVPPGGDRLWLRIRKDGVWGEPIAVTDGHGDLFKCSTAVDGQGRAWLFWSENKHWLNQELADFEVWGRYWNGKDFSSPINLSSQPGNDLNPAAAVDRQGRIWLAWQGARDGRFRILERHQEADNAWSPERIVSPQETSCWAPAVAADAGKSGNIAIAWDTYQKGDYDVWLRQYSATGEAREAMPVADTSRFEARPKLTFDHDERLWICWEEGGPLWGKNFGAYAINDGVGLYRDRQLNLRILDRGRWLDPTASLLESLPGAKPRRRSDPLPVRRPEEAFVRDWQTRLPGKDPKVTGNGYYNNSAGIACDSAGRIWVLVRSREGTFRAPVGSVWLNYASYYDGTRWVGPVQLPHSDNLLYTVPAIAQDGAGLLVSYASDHRQDRYVSTWGPLCLGDWSGGIGSAWFNPGDPFVNDIFVSHLEVGGPLGQTLLKPAAETPAAHVLPSVATLKERENIARCRAVRVVHNGVTLRLMRGEFHRHTEISSDGGTDGTIEDMWRYAIDVAGMDWLGCGDHDNGEGPRIQLVADPENDRRLPPTRQIRSAVLL